MSESHQDTYLGDGVYASYDGFQVWLAVNHHTNKQIALDSNVMHALLRYADKVWGEKEEQL